ncbi:gamma-glutamylcyclotransferase [Senegalia sp. (in: firmicutes)]|uniref:gamma-glutamylcyclotransferase n=1 Tax=Senegalia sp. (in: firmicutes) TaxID=1924098 RepID=UPI003F943A55
MDKFFSKKYRDRCRKSLESGRIMSMFNEDCICLECKDKEIKDPRYEEARDAEAEEVKKGKYNFKGIGK